MQVRNHLLIYLLIRSVASLYSFLHAVVWNPWKDKAKGMSDFGDEDYREMVCVESAAIEKPITLKPGEEWQARQELKKVPSSFVSGPLEPALVKATVEAAALS